MALLRGVADVTLMGAGTIAGSSSANWTPFHLVPAVAEPLRRWRADLGLSPNPPTIIVTGGDVRLGKRGVDDPSLPVIFLTTEAGAHELAARGFGDHVEIVVAGSGERVEPDAIAAYLARYRGQIVLCEGGPHLLGNLVEADLVDELFLTVAPQLIGRGEDRIGLVEGVALPPDDARWQELVSVKRAADHLFLRYRRRS
jgi:riboflavin biosynthesis pyrimidine reductase